MRTHLAKNQVSVLSQDVGTPNKISKLSLSKPSEDLSKAEYLYFTTAFETTMVLTKTDEEVDKMMKAMRDEKNTGHDGIIIKILEIFSTIIEKN